MDRDTLDKLRAMSHEYHRLMRAGMPADDDSVRHIAEVTNMLACSVDYLLAEIDRLRDRAQAEPERVRVLKKDRTGGSA